MRRTLLARLRARRRGLTLVELMITLLVLGVLVAIGAPSMYEFIMRKRVEGVADELLVDLRLMRSSSMVSSKSVQGEIRFTSNASMSCYVIYTRDPFGGCNCLNTPVCSSMSGIPTQQVKLVRLPASRAVSVMPATGTPGVMTLDRISSLPMSGVTLNLEVSAPSGGKVRVSTNALGQPAICSVSGHESAYGACTP